MNNQIDSNYYARCSDVSSRLIGDDGAILYHPDISREKAINASGLFIWQQLDGSRDINAIAGKMAQIYETDSSGSLTDDIEAFLIELTDEGFTEVSNTSIPKSLTVPDFADVSDSPKSLDLSLTGKCNLHCAYCFYHDEMASRPDLPIEDWLTFFAELKQLGVRDATLSGGEVFVRPDLWTLIDALIDSRMRYSILSNGTLITEKTIREFEKGRRFKRLNSIQISIDGSCADVHDKSRGSGSFTKAVRALRLLKNAGFPVTVRVTVNRHNVDDLDNIARLLLEDIGISSFGTNDAMPMGSGCDNQKTITLTPQQQVTAMKTLARLEKQYNGRIMATAGPLAKWYSYQEMERAKKTGEMSRRWKMGFLTACGCTYNKLSVHHDGIITPCNMLAKLVMGHINRDALTGIWKNSPTLKALKDRRNIPMTEVPGCEDCEWAPFCNGSCPGLAHEMTGDVNLANPHDCYRRFLRETGGLDYRL
jgi:SynChlorMet cassette radical SAM/SPASM protein ScmE